MYSAPNQAPHSQYGRSSSQEQTPSQQYPPAAGLQAQSSAPHQSPSPSGPAYPDKQQQEASPGAFAPQAVSTATSAPGYLRPSHQRQRSTSLGRPQPSGDIPDLKRSHSLNENMSNPQTSYYQMAAAPMGAYQQQIYGQSAIQPSSMSAPRDVSSSQLYHGQQQQQQLTERSDYYQTLPQSSVPLSSGYMESRPGMQSMDYYQSTMPYGGQSTYPASYNSSYASNSSAMGPSYGSPMTNQQYPRPPQPALPGAPPVQVVDRAKKPQCWEHGCNGREFSTFSNLLRHQREKSGTAAKSYCPHCGAEFTRTTARNGHMEHGKCKTRRATTSTS